MAILQFVNLKGGAAKTTTAVALAECLASKGHRTLLIDADHQCRAGELLLGEDRQVRCARKRRTLQDLLAALLDPDARRPRFEAFVAGRASSVGGGLERLDVLPCSVRIDDVAANVVRARDRFGSNEEFLRLLDRRRTQLRRWLRAHYDFTLIDGPPSLAFPVRFLLPVADAFIVPSVPDRLAVRGALYLMERLRAFGDRIAPLGTLWSLYRAPNAQHRRFVRAASEGRRPFNRLPAPFRTVIPDAVPPEAPAEPRQPPATFRAKYRERARVYESLCAEVVKRVQALPGRTPRSAQECEVPVGVWFNYAPPACLASPRRAREPVKSVPCRPVTWPGRN